MARPRLYVSLQLADRDAAAGVLLLSHFRGYALEHMSLSTPREQACGKAKHLIRQMVGAISSEPVSCLAPNVWDKSWIAEAPERPYHGTGPSRVASSTLKIHKEILGSSAISSATTQDSVAGKS